MKEFGFYNDFDDTLMLNEQIEINNEKEEYLVSNSPKLKANIIASEINFYLKNTTASVLEKAKSTLYFMKQEQLHLTWQRMLIMKKKSEKMS